MRIFWFIYYLAFIGIALVCFTAGGLDFVKQQAFFARAAPATGTITAYDLHVRNDGKSEYCPRIEFTTSAGQPITYYGSDCPSQPDAGQIGQRVTLYYDPNNANDVRTPGLGDEYTGLIFGLIGGVFFLFVALVTFLASRGSAVLERRKNSAATTPADREAAIEARDRASILARSGSEADVQAWLEKRRRRR